MTVVQSRYTIAQVELFDEPRDPGEQPIVTVEIGVLSVGADWDSLVQSNDVVREHAVSATGRRIGEFGAFKHYGVEPQIYVISDVGMLHWLVIGATVHVRSTHGLTTADLTRQLDLGYLDVKAFILHGATARAAERTDIPKANADELLVALTREVLKRIDAARDAAEDNEAATAGGDDEPIATGLTAVMLQGAFGSGVPAAPRVLHRLVWFGQPGAGE